MGVATCSVFVTIFFFLFFLLLLINPVESECPKPFHCGDVLGNLDFPFTNYTEPDCGLFPVNCEVSPPRLQLRPGGVWYEFHDRMPLNKVKVVDPDLRDLLLPAKRCSAAPWNGTKSHFPFISFTFSPNLTIFSCFNHLPDPHPEEMIEDYFKDYKNQKCPVSTFYYKIPPEEEDISIPERLCWMFQMPVKPDFQKLDDLFQMLTAEFEIEYYISEECLSCHRRGSKCLNNTNNEFLCEEKTKNSHKAVIIATAVSVGAVFVGICLIVSFILYRRKKRNNGSYLLSRNIPSDPSSKSDIEVGSFHFGIHIFSYEELEKATNNFDSSQELGDGGFGTVYYGKLRDGREVAIKRLYEHNCRRVEQFLNEIKILTGLRHPNLVSLYGCTSRRSRELLLVYEYISNGTVADHLHGERAKEAPLTWPVRMSIAIETANALAYLHKSDIIHRDVKTNNILLDSSFCVKVADFGLSRLFPNDVTHISTAPQGTPGYVDPEYHQCYQLTDKSDVYSFGVVLIELISSMPAVDISRHRHEINLANLAVNRIQQCAFDELIDPSLGYNSDAEVTRMTTTVAELAFRCLQLEKDLRPSMDEVLAFLTDIQDGGDCKFEKVDRGNGYYGVHGKRIPPSPESDDAVLLKNKNFQSSPVAVTDTWVSSSSTTTSSIG